MMAIEPRSSLLNFLILLSILTFPDRALAC
jgi:hypothetical protein